MFVSIILDSSYGSCSNSALWHIDDTPYSQVIFTIFNSLQICKQIFDFPSCIEIDSTHDFIRYIGNNQLFFKHTGLCIGAIQNRMVIISLTFHVYISADIPNYKFCLFICTVKLSKLHLLSLFILCPECFCLSSLVVGNNCVCGIQNVPRRAIILFQFDNLGVRKDLFKVQNILYICTTEFVN